jgi:diketogulonate reductase-like aldo/keto reductase
VALALRQHNVCAIPTSGSAAHVQEYAVALGVKLGKDDLDELDLAFPPPLRARRLETRWRLTA